MVFLKNGLILITLVSLSLTGCDSSSTSISESDSKTPQYDDAATQPAEAPVQARVETPQYPLTPYFGDTHLHTALSMDAGMTGTSLMPSDGYRFAKGEEVTSNTGLPMKLSRPLDFVVVADHSDNLGFAADFNAGAKKIVSNAMGKQMYDLAQEGKLMQAFGIYLQAFGNGTIPEELNYLPGHPEFASAWDRIIVDAEEANEPHKFTAFIGYEWTSMPGGNNLHRNVIYRDNAVKAKQELPYTTVPPLGSDNPRDLWNWMDAYERKTGGQLLAIAHNGNWSNGTMFPAIEPDTGQAIDLAYAKARSKWEPLYEITQMKGDGEAHPYLSPNDEFADYETWDAGNAGPSAAKTKDMLEFEYARSALKNGLAFDKSLGANPYEFGVVGSTDSHTGAPAIEENQFFGKTAAAEPSPDRAMHVFLNNPGIGIKIVNWETIASGYAVVWAQENTRESLFDAMKRKETYATTGSRPVVRLFGGYDFTAADLNAVDVIQTAYSKGVPMGGNLPSSSGGKAPSFMVMVQKDPMGANLDRAQIVKGWLDADGQTQEKVYNVAWGDADKRPMDEQGKIPPVGNTVDTDAVTWEDSIGDESLMTVWTDPDFDPATRAFYYLRVIEIPTPRWTAYDAKQFGLSLPEEVPLVHTERAYTSSIWYRP